MHGHVHATRIFSCHLHAEIIIPHAAVPETTVCVTFGALHFGTKFGNIYGRSEYDAFCTISAIAVREMTVCVAFGALHFNFLLAILEHPHIDQTGGVSVGTGFRELRG